MTNQRTAQNFGPAHLLHHDRHWEWCYDFAGRLEKIRASKPLDEQAVRLKYSGLIPLELLPTEVR